MSDVNTERTRNQILVAAGCSSLSAPRLAALWKAGHEDDPLYQLNEGIERKFNSSQPRVPAGSPGGGQWTSGDGISFQPNPTNKPETTGSSGTETNVGGSDGAKKEIGSTGEPALDSVLRRLAAGPKSYPRCLDICFPLLERFQRPGSDRSQWDFHRCMNACLGRK